MIDVTIEQMRVHAEDQVVEQIDAAAPEEGQPKQAGAERQRQHGQPLGLLGQRGFEGLRILGDLLEPRRHPGRQEGGQHRRASGLQ